MVVRVKTVVFGSNPGCPVCGNGMSYIDSKKRKTLDYGHAPKMNYVRRFRCDKCNRIHTELPEAITPNKHYKTSVISDVLSGRVVEGDAICELGPSDLTMARWRKEYL